MFGVRLKTLRNEKKLTQDELGKMLNVSGKTIGTWERDSRQPNIEAINKLASIFNVTTDYLLGRVNSKTEKSIKKDDPLDILSQGHFRKYDYTEEEKDQLRDELAEYLEFRANLLKKER